MCDNVIIPNQLLFPNSKNFIDTDSFNNYNNSRGKLYYILILLIRELTVDTESVSQLSKVKKKWVNYRTEFKFGSFWPRVWFISYDARKTQVR